MSAAPVPESRRRSCLYEGRVAHARRGDLEHRFTYRLYYLALDLDELEELEQELRLFGWRRRRLFRFADEDHGGFLDDAAGDESSPAHEPGPAPGASLRERVRAFVAGRTGFRPQRILLLSQVRLCGYVFNPVCFYFLYDERDRLRYTLVEVNNTFGVQSAYLLPATVNLAANNEARRARVPKILHVSPFLEAELDFAFDFDPPGEHLRIRIDSRRAGDEGGPARLAASLTGRRRELSDRALLACFLRYPAQTLLVIARIHWQALRLWRKGAPFHKMSAVHERIARRLGNRPSFWSAS